MLKTLIIKQFFVNLNNYISKRLKLNKLKQITSEIIKYQTCQYFNITLDELRTRTRNRNISKCRKLAIYLVRSILLKKTVLIAKDFKLDQSVTSKYLKEMDFLAKNDKETKRDIQKIKDLIESYNGCSTYKALLEVRKNEIEKELLRIA